MHQLCAKYFTDSILFTLHDISLREHITGKLEIWGFKPLLGRQ